MSVLNAPMNATTGIAPATQSTTGNGSSSSTSSSAFNQINEQSFLKLLTTQLQHQDPTQPVKEQQLAGEMAAFSTATGVNTLNNTAQGMASTQTASALSKASALVGKQVTTSGDALVTNASGHATGAFKLNSAAKNVAVNVADASGKTVGQVSLGALGAGTHTFQWANGSPNQAYQFSVAASNSGGGSVTATPASLYTVTGVQSSGGAVSLSLAGSPNSLALSNVQQIL
ncbi:flagellar hook assembly protein FlgD [Salinisphaera sp. RV14]|uniref:flagellar hook assembly protein FlgD n=1 Tax=unclassified Salinisphaera TaxID=2649847 RepID=UPI003F84AE36